MTPPQLKVASPAANPESLSPAAPAAPAASSALQVCGVEINPKITKEAFHLLVPEKNFTVNPLFAGAESVTKIHRDKARQAEEAGDQYLAQAQQIVSQAQNDADEKIQAKLADKFERAFNQYSHSLELSKDSNAKQLIFKLAMTAGNTGRIPYAGELYRLLLAQDPCEPKIREARMEINKMMMETIRQRAAEIQEKDRAAYTAMFNQAAAESVLDQGLLLGIKTREVQDQIAEQLKGFNEGDSKKQGEALKAAFPLVQELMELSEMGDSNGEEAQVFATRPEQVARQVIETILQNTKDLKDPEVQKYHLALKAYHESSWGNPAKAVGWFRQLCQAGYKEIGEGDPQKGREQVAALLADQEKIQSMEDLQKFQAKLSDLPPGLLEGHHFLEKIAQAQAARSDGLKILGQGDEAQGRVKMNTLLAKADEMQAEVARLAQEIQGLANEGKKEEAQKKALEAKEKLEAGSKVFEEVFKTFPSQEAAQAFIGAFQFLHTIEAARQREANQKALAVWSSYQDETNRKNVDEALGFWRAAAGATAALFRATPWLGDGKTHFDDLQEAYDQDLRLYLQVQSLVGRGEVNSVKKALEEVEKSGIPHQPDQEALKSRATELLNLNEEGFSLVDVFDYAAAADPDPEKGKALLEAAEKLAADPAMKRTARAVVELVADTAQDNDLIQLAREQLGSLSSS